MKRINKKSVFALIIIIAIFSASLFAGPVVSSGNSREEIEGSSRSVPDLIDYQGRLTDSDGTAIDGAVSITFAIYDVENGGVALWTETQNPVEVSDGLFHVLLGSETAFPADLFDESNRWIGINVAGDGEMTPRCRIASVPFALQTGSAAPDNDWTISGDDIYKESGNVGIGTTSPDYPLDVVGYLSVEPSAGSGSYAKFGSASYKAQLLFHDGTDYTVAIRSSGNSYFKGGNVGIGTTSPDYPLDVDGTVNATAFVGDGSGLTNIQVEVGDATTLDGIDSGSFLRSDETDTSTEKITFSKTPFSGAVYAGPVYINPESASSGYTLLGVAVDGDQKFRIDAEGDIHLEQNSEFTMTGSGSGSLDFDAAFLDYTININAETINLGDTSDDEVIVDGKLGIGTDAPDTKLEISGTGDQYIRVTSTDNQRAGIEFIRSGTTYRDWRLYDDAGNLHLNYDGNGFIDGDGTNLMFWNYQYGRVGIGTSSPSSKLTVSGGTSSVDLLIEADTDNAGGESEHPTMSFSQDGGDVVGKIGFFDDYGSNDFTMYNSYSGGGLNFGAGDSKALEIDSDHDFHITRPDGIKTFLLESSENGSDGSQINMYDSNGNATVVLDAESDDGSYMDFYTNNGVKTVRIQSTETNDGSDGSQIQLYKADGTASITLDAEYGVGGNSRIFTEVLEITGGSDIAEPFDINGSNIKEGMVLSIDSANPGKLKISEKAYDRCVAGIVSGAGGINAGMIMGQEGSVADGNIPVALTGRVYCHANASNGAIQPGDLLTTSDIPGYAMKVSDHEKAQGAIIGKAMTALENGEGLVLVLVSLQ